MRAGDPTEIPNPFALAPRAQRKSTRKSVLLAIKFFAIVAVCLCLTVVVGSQSRRWLANRLTSDFETLSPAAKKQRLLQIAELGVSAIDPLVDALADEDTEVARAAYDLLQRAQNEWNVLRRDDLQERHIALVDALNSIAVHVPDDRTGWASGLLHQTMMETVNQNDTASRELYKNANATLERYTLSQRSGPSVLVDEPLDPLMPRRLIVRPQPLPVAAAETDESWTDWPPTQDSTITASPQLGDDQANQPAVLATDPPSVYRSSSMRLQTVEPGEMVDLRELNQPLETSYQSAELRPVTNIVESPMQTLDDRSVIHWLGSPHRALREKAKLELIRRGFDGNQITIATRVASADTKTRTELVDVIARDQTIDPRPWLIMLLDDENREVKLRAISVLATMNDPAVVQELRMRLVDQSDPIVAARLSRVLNVR